MTVGEIVLVPGAPRTRAYLALTLVALAATVAFSVRWLTMPGRWDHPVLYVLASLTAAYYLAIWYARWVALRGMASPAPRVVAPGLAVAVATAFVPGDEPLEMLEITVRALVAMEYPHETWVLDEGDDAGVRALCEKVGARHFSRRHQTRYQQPAGRFAAHTKHGNYNAWLTEAAFGKYDVVVTFDADHVPERDYLHVVLGYFSDDIVAYVQTPPAYYNQGASFIARGAAEETYAYASSHQMASYAVGHPIVVGSHSAHRVEALRSVDGFPAHDAEDLYLTMAYRAAGWQGVYVPRIVARGTTPVDWPGYLRQQMRWTRALIDLKLRVFPLFARRLALLSRVLNLFHGAYFLRPVAFACLVAMLVAMLMQNAVPVFLSPRVLGEVVALAVVLHAIDRYRQLFYLDPARERGWHWRAELLQLGKWPHIAASIVGALMSPGGGYVITRKVVGGRKHWVVAPPHVAIALLVAAAAAVGVVRNGSLAPVLWVFAALTTALSLTIALTETWAYPPPFDAALLSPDLRPPTSDLRPPTSDLRPPT